MTDSATKKLAKNIALYCGAAVIFISLAGLVNRVIIADPIARAMTEERTARQFADSLIIYQLRALRGRDVPGMQNSVDDVGDDVVATKTQLRDAANRNFHKLEEVDAKLDYLINRRVQGR